jgi:hypothetical protein
VVSYNFVLLFSAFRVISPGSSQENQRAPVRAEQFAASEQS